MFKLAAAGMLFAVSCNLLPAQTSAEKPVIEAVQKLFDAMKSKDAAGIRALVLPGGQFVSIRADGKTSSSSADKFADAIAGSKEVLVEKMWDPKVMVQDNIATLWAPYDFHRDDKFSHCGIDAVSLLKVSGEWKIATITYNVQQQGCTTK